MGSRPLLAGLLLVCAAALFILYPRGGSGEDGTAAPPAPAAAAPAAPAAADGPPEAEPAGAGVATREELAPQGPAPAAAAEDAFLPPSDDPDALLVRCLDRETGAPLAGATVFHLDQARMSEETMILAFTGSVTIGDLLLRFADRYRADARGEVRVPYSGDLVVAARDGGRFQMEQVWDQPPGSIVLLELYEQTELAVEVVDERGAPVAGVSVTLRAVWDQWRLDLLRQDTDADGRAVFREFDVMRESFDMGAMFVGLGEALAEPVEIPLPEDAAADGAPPLRLVLPPCGTVEVAVRDAAGAPARDDVLVVLTPWSEDVDMMESGFSGGDGRTAYAPVRDGVARFDYVGLGQELSVGAFLGGLGTPSTAAGRGPARAGETVRLEVQEDASVPVLTGRILAGDTPLAGEVVQVVVRAHDGEDAWDEERNVQLDAAGAFLLNLGGHAEDTQRLEMLVRRLAGGEAMWAQVELPVGFTGTHDVGAVTLTPAPLIVAGRVVDAAGAAVASARLDLQREERWGESDEEVYWEDLSFTARSDADGRFRLAGILPGEGVFRVAAAHPAHIRRVQPVTPGQDDVELRLDAACGLEGRVLVDAGFPADQLEIAIDYGEEPVGVEYEPWAAVLVDGSFRVGQLPPGIVRLSVESNASEEDLHVIEQVVLAPGAPSDPRLAAIDLRGKVFHHSLDVRDLDGRPVSDFMVVERGVEDGWHWGSGGEFGLVSARRSIDVDVVAEGYRSLEVLALAGHREVRLAAGIPVVVRWSGPRPEFEGCTWGVRVEPADPSSPLAWLITQHLEFDDSGELRVLVGGPGAYRVVTTLRHDATWNIADVDGATPLTVREGGNPVVTVGVTAEQAAQAHEAALQPPDFESMLEELGYGGD